MAGRQDQGFQNQQVQGALQQGNAFVFALLGSHSTQVFARSGRMSTRTTQSFGMPPGGQRFTCIVFARSALVLMERFEQLSPMIVCCGRSAGDSVKFYTGENAQVRNPGEPL